LFLRLQKILYTKILGFPCGLAFGLSLPANTHKGFWFFLPKGKLRPKALRSPKGRRVGVKTNT
jgi:hypothetical protein